jgi:hypothetical protein
VLFLGDPPIAEKAHAEKPGDEQEQGVTVLVAKRGL